jgi:hypothetical protein
MRQWYAVRRLDKQLLPPAQAMFEFLGEEGCTYLPSFQFARSRQIVQFSGL